MSDFEAELFKLKNGMEIAKGGFVWNEDFIPSLIRNVEYGNLFTYMFRRFGIPEYGSDSRKQIANWYITTPDKNVCLEVSPCPSGIMHCFGYALDRQVYNDRFNKNQVQFVEKALSAAMLDLLRPTYVMDVYINILGVLKDEDIENEVSPAKWAGYGVEQEYFDNRFGDE